MTRRSIVRWAFAGLSAALAVCAGLAAFAERAPDTALARWSARWLPLVSVRLWAVQHEVSLRPRAELPRITREIDQILALAPDRLDTWLLKVDALSAANEGKASPGVISALAHSYELSPLSYSYGGRRTRFGYDHWLALTPPLRGRVGIEFKCLSRVAPEETVSDPAQIVDPAGRFAAAWDLKAVGGLGPLCRLHPTE